MLEKSIIITNKSEHIFLLIGKTGTSLPFNYNYFAGIEIPQTHHNFLTD